MNDVAPFGNGIESYGKLSKLGIHILFQSFNNWKNLFTGQAFLTPTKIYVKELLPLIEHTFIKGIVNITGGGILENIPRVTPSNACAEIDASLFEILPIFGWIAAKANMTDTELLKTFNCGIGMILIVSADYNKDLVIKQGGKEIGKIVERNGGPGVRVLNFSQAIQKSKSVYLSNSNQSSKSITYEDCGVSIISGDKLVTDIKPLAKITNVSGVIGGLGGFGGLFSVNDYCSKYKNPILVMGTDGVGTKLKVAQLVNKHNTIGIDLVAMCVNDIVCTGASPVTFLDYYACGKLDVNLAKDVISGISFGCNDAGCALIGKLYLFFY